MTPSMYKYDASSSMASYLPIDPRGHPGLTSGLDARQRLPNATQNTPNPWSFKSFA